MEFNLIARIKEVALRRRLGIRPYGERFEDSIIRAIGMIPKDRLREMRSEFRADQRLERRESEE